MKKFNLLFVFITICFSAFSQAPTITSFSPASGPVGTLVTITGTNLSTPTAFTIGGVAAIVVSDDGTALVGMVMPGAVTGVVSVTTAGGTATGGSNFAVTPTGYPGIQLNTKLVGTVAKAGDFQGWSVALSADGNTAIVGGIGADTTGGAWIYTRTGGIWTQQGGKLVGTGSTGNEEQGFSVALSADGNTAMVGGPDFDTFTGAAWVFIRTGNTWAQQGSKLIGTGARGAGYQGTSVALSADGYTAIVGGPLCNLDTGGAWIYTRTGSNWAQQGGKLVGTGSAGYPHQGCSVSLSADGNTAMIGAIIDNNSMGAAWVFTRTGSIWTQQGTKILGTGALGQAHQGGAIAVSADGSTAIVGGNGDNSFTGASWIFSSDSSVPCTPDSVTISQTICQGGSVTFGGRQFTTSGSYTDAFTNVNGCDSIITLTLTVNPLPVVSLSWDNLVAAHILFSNINPDTAFVPVCSPLIFAMVGGYPPGGTYSGRYIVDDTAMMYLNQTDWGTIDTVVYTYTDSNGCGNMASDSLFLDFPCEGINDVSGANSISLYPNPNRGSFTLSTVNGQQSTNSFTISDMLGNIVAHDVINSNQQSIELKDAAEGVYTLVVKGASPVRFVIVK